MLRKSISLVTALVAMVMLFGQQAVRADSHDFYAGAISGVGTPQVYTVGAAHSDAGAASGWMYFGMADGSWIDSSVISLSVSANGDTQAVCAGWINDQTPCYTYLTVTGTGASAKVSVNVMMLGAVTPALDSASGSIFYGAFLAL